LKGELLKRIRVRYQIKNKGTYWGGYKLQKTLEIKMFSSATVWEFKQRVSKALGLAPKYAQFILPDDAEINETQHGNVISQLGIKNGDIITVRKLKVNEEIKPAPLVDEENKTLTPRAAEIFTEWFELYKDPELNMMNDVSVAKFVSNATRQTCEKDDKRVLGLITQYATLPDSKEKNALTLKEYLDFWYSAASGTQTDAVYSNLKNHNIRPDLKKLTDIDQEAAYKITEMPRYVLSHNQTYFDTLFSLLDRNDESSADVWDLVRMLNTNKQTFMQVLSLKSDATNEINWSKVFEDSSLYK